jgi:nitric oxide reductase NorQ protein
MKSSFEKATESEMAAKMADTSPVITEHEISVSNIEDLTTYGKESIISKLIGDVAAKAAKEVASKVVVKTPLETLIDDTKEDYITLKDKFFVQKADFKFLCDAISEKINVLIFGDTGAGKTEMIKYVGDFLSLPVSFFDMGAMTDPILGLIGTHVIKTEDGKAISKFFPSRFSEVIQRPGIVVLDEINRNTPMSNNLLFPCLDFRRTLSMEYSFDSMEPINIHPDCIFVATANVGNSYSGTSKIDRALLDRFMCMTIENLDQERITKIVKVNYPDLGETTRSIIVDVYTKINKANDEFTIDFRLSPRHIHNICKLVSKGNTIFDAYYIITNGLGSKAGTEFIKTITGLTKSKSLISKEA